MNNIDPEIYNTEIYKNFDRVLSAIGRANYFLAMITQEVNRYCAVQNQWFLYEPVDIGVSYSINNKSFTIHQVVCSAIMQDNSQNIYSMAVSFPSKYLSMDTHNITQDYYSEKLLEILENLEEEKERLEMNITLIQAGYKIVFDARSKGIDIQ